MPTIHSDINQTLPPTALHTTAAPYFSAVATELSSFTDTATTLGVFNKLY